MFRVDRLILTPPMIDLDRSPLAGQFDAETYVLGAFNPGMTRLPNGKNYGFAVNTMHIVANKAFTDALATPELRARLTTLMAEASPGTPEQFGSFVKSELAKYEGVVKASGAKID